MLRATGQRVTAPRLAVLECLIAATGDHMSADDLLGRLDASHPEVHRATVYRTLDSLTKAGVLRHVHLDRGVTAYHLPDNMQRPAHLHAQCSSCGAVVDLPPDILGDAVRRVRKASGFELDPSHVALSGRCADCAGS
jgi:Fur family ferric uptake transcriptional regulator